MDEKYFILTKAPPRLMNQVTSSKFLGVILDQHLSLKTHMNAISCKIAKNVGILKQASCLLPNCV